jgi:hypothetical protein
MRFKERGQAKCFGVCTKHNSTFLNYKSRNHFLPAAAFAKEQGNVKECVCLLPQHYFEVGSLYG